MLLNGCASAHLEPELGPELEPRNARFAQTGLASWYGRAFQGRRTASGASFDQNQMTAAHPTLKFGTRLRVTNLLNQKTVIVIVNDRGPYSGGRIIDVSRRAARELGFIAAGVARVRIEVIDP